MTAISKILCPTDFSEHAQNAIDFAAELAKPFGATIELLHVFQLPIYVGWEGGPTSIAATDRHIVELREHVQGQLQKQVDALKAKGVKATSQDIDGVPHLQIAKSSEEADLVVMGTHGRTGLPRLLLGSVAERVVRLAHCPVITVPRHDHD